MTPFRGSNQEQQSYILHSRIVALYESEMLSICQKRSPLAFHTSTESIHSSIRLISEFTIRASDSRLRIIESTKIQTNEHITETSSRKNTWHIHQKHQNLIWKLALTQCKKPEKALFKHLINSQMNHHGFSSETSCGFSIWVKQSLWVTLLRFVLQAHLHTFRPEPWTLTLLRASENRHLIQTSFSSSVNAFG